MKKDSLNDVLPYFSPIDWINPAVKPLGLGSDFRQYLALHKEAGLENLDNAEILILGSPNNTAADTVRSHLYALGGFEELNKVADLGNFRNGKSIGDTLKGWEDVLFELGKKEKIIIIIGGHSEGIGSTLNGMSQLEHPINLAVISPDLHLINDPKDQEASYLNRQLLDPKSQLFDFTHLAYQSYFTENASLELLDKMYFNYVRLGELRTDIREVEPYFRNSDILAFSLASIRYSDAPGTRLNSANGLYAEEACQLARFAGLSDKLTTLHLFDLGSEEGIHDVTANLTAQIIWHFIQGITQRKKDYPFAQISSYHKYIVNVPQADHEINFYKSPYTERWWLEVPYPPSQYERSLIVACTAKDYQMACNGEIPDRWLKNYQRIC
jgi:formiminoglutamase